MITHDRRLNSVENREQNVFYNVITKLATTKTKTQKFLNRRTNT